MDEAARKAFGIFLKSLREGVHLTQKEAAKQSGLSAPYLAQLERGQRNPPSRAALTRLADTYQVTPQSLSEHAEYGEKREKPLVSSERVEWAFRAASSDPEFSYGHRARHGTLTLDQKIWFVQLYEKSTNRRLLTEQEAEQVAADDEREQA